MARTARSYTIVFKEPNGDIDTSTYANADALRDALAHRDDHDSILVFEGEPVIFTVDTSPRVTLGEKKERKPKGERKPRAKKSAATASGGATPTPINGSAHNVSQ